MKTVYGTINYKDSLVACKEICLQIFGAAHYLHIYHFGPHSISVSAHATVALGYQCRCFVHFCVMAGTGEQE